MTFPLDDRLASLRERACERAVHVSASLAPDARIAGPILRDWLGDDLWGGNARSPFASAIVIAELASASPWLALCLGHHLSACAALERIGCTTDRPDSFTSGRKILCFGFLSEAASTSASDGTSPSTTRIANAQVADSMLCLASRGEGAPVSASLRPMSELSVQLTPHPHVLLAEVTPKSPAPSPVQLDAADAEDIEHTHAHRLALAIAATSLGVAENALGRAIERGRARRNRLPQTEQFTLSDSATETDAARLLLYRAASSEGPDASAYAAKLLCTRTATRVVHGAMQTGDASDSELASLYLVAAFLESYETSANHDLDRVAVDMLQE